MRRPVVLAPLVVAVLVASAALATPASDDARPVSGRPLEPGTGLRLLVADDRPFVLDVDGGRARPLGLPRLLEGVTWVVPVGAGAVVAAEGAWGRAALHAVTGLAGRVRALGRGADVVAGADGRSVWVKRRAAGSCSLVRLTLGGRALVPARRLPCGVRVGPDTALGLVAGSTRILDPRTGRTRLRVPGGVLAAAGSTLVLAKGSGELALLDGTTGAERLLGRPSALRGPGEAAADPSGRFVAIEFADPAWGGGPEQALDVWVLDTAAGTLTRLPGMPALVSLKATSMAWTRAGRLVLLGERRGRAFVAAWRPGEADLAVKAVALPERDGGSDSFAVLG